MKRRHSFHVFAGCAIFLAVSGLAVAQDYPSRPIRIVVPTPAGGIFDIVARIVAEKISVDLGKPIIVENRPGADGNIGIDAVAKSAPDGYTWLISGPALLINPLIYGNLPWNGLRDFQGVGVPALVQNVAVIPATLPVKTLKEFVAYATARPGQLNFGNPGNGSSPHLSSELLFQVTGIKLTSINYKGQPPLMPDLLSGQVHFTVLALGIALPHIKSGKLRPLAVFTPERVAAMPEVPTVAEAGYAGASLVPWYGIYVPIGTPKDLVARINSVLNNAIGSAVVQSRLMTAGALPGLVKTPEDIQMMARDDAARWGKVVRDAGIKVE